MLKDVIYDVGGTSWKVRQAASRHEAMNAITEARTTGSVGLKTILNETFIGGGETILADVVQINSDGSERQPYSAAY